MTEIKPSEQKVPENQPEAKNSPTSTGKEMFDIKKPATQNEDKTKLTQQVREAQRGDEQSQYLMFLLDHDVYALDILKVREIVDVPAITRVPHVPSALLGVMNLRGSVIPVVDLKQRFDLAKTEIEGENTCIIVVEKEETNKPQRLFGLVVDAVQGVIHLEPEHISQVTAVGIGLDTDYIRGVGNHNNQFVMILELNKILMIEVVQSNFKMKDFE